MELLSVCLIALTTVLTLWFLKTKTKNQLQPLLPPGPWMLPVIGSLHHVVSVLPHRRLAELSRRHGPLMFLRLGEVPTMVVSNAEGAALVMKTNDPVFASRPRSTTLDIFSCGGKDIAYAPYSDHWRQMRKVCMTELLNAKQVKRLEGMWADEVGCLVRSIAASASAGAAVNVTDKVKALSNDVVSRAAFGGKFTQQEEFLHELDRCFELVGGFSLVDLFPSSRLVRWLSNDERRMRQAYGRTQSIIADIIDERKAAGGDGACISDSEDLLGVLLRLQREDSLEFPLTKESMGAVLFDIFAGTDTSGVVLEWAMSELVRHPKAMAKAQLEIREVLGQGRVVISNSDLAELHYMRMVIKEVLRLHPPAPLIARMTREDCKILGYDFLKGTNVYVNVFAISREPKYWENPEEFQPERFKDENMDYNMTNSEFTFGAGRRQCAGMLFGMSTVHTALANLLYHFDWMILDGTSPASFDMSEKFGMLVGRRYGLQLRAISHKWAKSRSS